MANTKKSIEEIMASDGQTLKPYEVFRLWQNEIDKLELSEPRVLIPQMAYNYDRNGMIVKGRSSKQTGTAGRYSVEEAMAFIAKWILKNYKIDITPLTVAEEAELEDDECDGQEDLLELIEA